MNNKKTLINTENVISPEDAVFDFATHADGPSGKIPFTAEILIDQPSGDHFGMSQNFEILKARP